MEMYVGDGTTSVGNQQASAASSADSSANCPVEKHFGHNLNKALLFLSHKPISAYGK